MFEAPGLRGAHEEEKPASVMDCNKCKIGLSKSDQMLHCTLIPKNICEVVEKIHFFFFFLSSKYPHSASQNIQSETAVFEESGRGLLGDMGIEITEQSPVSSAGILVCS